VSPGSSGGNPGRGGVSCGGGAGSDGGALVPLRLQRACRFFAVPYSHKRQPSILFLLTIAGGVSIAANTSLCPGKSTLHFFYSRTSV